jgi:hypothetical protein
MGIFRNRPSVGLSDNLNDTAPGRHSWYGDAYVVPVGMGRHTAAEEASYYTAVNPTLATAITGHVAPAIADGATKPLIHIYNGGSRFVSIDYIKLATIVVNASSTSTDYLVYLSNDGASSRTSGGTAIVPGNCRSDGAATAATCYAGAVVAAPVNAVKVSQWTVRPVIAVAEDQYFFSFGNGVPALNAHGVINGTTIASVMVATCPVVVAPGGNFHFVQIGPSGAATAQTVEFEMGFWER